MKRKRFKLKRTRVYSPIIAVLGGKHHTDYMPISYGTPIHVSTKKVKTNTKGFCKALVRNKETFNSQKY